MAKVRLQIELDEKAYKCICGDGITLFNTGMRCGKTLFSQILVAIRNATPTQTCTNCLRRNNDFFKKWLNYKMLDEIKADIEQYQADCDLSCSDDGNCKTCNNITFGSIYRIIDKYRKGDKE